MKLTDQADSSDLSEKDKTAVKPLRNMRCILHVDMDAFFAAVEQLDRPELRGLPVVVGSSPNQRGVVCTASYEARKFGIHSAMPSRTAYQRCQHAIFLPVRGARYKQISSIIMEVFEETSPIFEPLSIDEAFIDVSGLPKASERLKDIAMNVKRRVYERTGGMTCSVGVGPNKYLAKLASDMQKPNGLTMVPFDEKAIQEFLAPLPVRKIWGVGKVTAQHLEEWGVRTVKDLQERTVEDLQRFLKPSSAAHLHQLAFGKDERPVIREREEKSISNETTFLEDCRDIDVLKKTLNQLTEKVGRRLRKSEKFASTAQIKLRYSDFRTLTRQMPINPPAASDRELLKRARKLFADEHINAPVRLIGFGVTGLCEPKSGKPVQPMLFEEMEPYPEKERERDQRLDSAVDSLREKFGINSIKRGL